MNKVVIYMTISLDGYIAGPDDGPQYPLGKNGGMASFAWYFSGNKDVKLGGASPGKQALKAGLVDEIYVHIAPYLLGGGVPLFDILDHGIRLEKLYTTDGP